MSLPFRIMDPKAGRPTVGMERRAAMTDHNGVLVMQRLLLAGTLGLTMARKAAAILDGESASQEREPAFPEREPTTPDGEPTSGFPLPDGMAPDESRLREGAILRAILDAANESLGHFDDRPPADRWCDALLHVLDLAAFAADLGSVL
jgi:hypothetical protein